MKCPRCHADNDEGGRFCEDCGARLELVCPRCGETVGAGKKFCRACGAALAPEPESLPSPQAYTPRHLAEKILTSRSALEGERKPVTVLFCDLANSTALAGRLGPDAMHVLLNRFFELALGEIHRYEGTINQFLGDGFMALFGAPLAHEDHARRAVLAALGLSRALREQRPALGAPADVDLAVRLGLNTGFVVVGRIGDNLRMDYTAVGDTTHLAARMQQLADPGTILVTEATARLVTGYVRLEVLEPVAVKGRPEPLTPYKVVALGRRRSPLDGLEERALSRFVGRTRDLATLHELLALVEAGQGQVVGLVGEPGVGKSRLLLEFRRSLADRRVTYLEGRCLSFGSSIPYLPVLDVVRSNCGIVETDGPETTAEKLRFGLQEVGLDPDAGLPYLLRLLGLSAGTDGLAMLSPEAIKARTFETLCQLSLKGSQRRPLIFAVEDLHWIDQTSQDYFAALVENLAGAPILMVGTYRPGYRPPWGDKSYATQLSLHRLTAQDSLSVVRSVLPEERLPDPLAQVILAKAEGNPFFLEELTRALAAQDRPSGDLTVPDTIHGVLMARIDRLPEEPKHVLQTAAVLGREFSLRLLAAIWDGPGVLEPHLLELKRLEFLYERLAADEPTYVFTHALTEDVAYDSLLLSRRQALHAAAGRAIEGLYAGRLDDVSERLAHHYGRTDQADKAVEYLIRAADKAARVYANADAVKALEEALRHVERLDPTAQDRPLIAIVLRLAHSFHFAGSHPGYPGPLAAAPGTAGGISRTRRSPARTTSGSAIPTAICRNTSARPSSPGRRWTRPPAVGMRRRRARRITWWPGSGWAPVTSARASSTVDAPSRSSSGPRTGSGSVRPTGRWASIITSWASSMRRSTRTRERMRSEKPAGTLGSRRMRSGPADGRTRPAETARRRSRSVAGASSARGTPTTRRRRPAGWATPIWRRATLRRPCAGSSGRPSRSASSGTRPSSPGSMGGGGRRCVWPVTRTRRARSPWKAWSWPPRVGSCTGPASTGGSWAAWPRPPATSPGPRSTCGRRWTPSSPSSPGSRPGGAISIWPRYPRPGVTGTPPEPMSSTPTRSSRHSACRCTWTAPADSPRSSASPSARGVLRQPEPRRPSFRFC